MKLQVPEISMKDVSQAAMVVGLGVGLIILFEKTNDLMKFTNFKKNKKQLKKRLENSFKSVDIFDNDQMVLNDLNGNFGNEMVLQEPISDYQPQGDIADGFVFSH